MNPDPLKEIASPKRASVLMVVAHPDDEVIGAGSRLALFRRLVIVHVTDGAPADMSDAAKHGFHRREDYALARRRELALALEEADARPQLIELRIPDQQATDKVEDIAERLTDLIEDQDPDIILTHPYEGGHPDHDACALAVRLVPGSAHRSIIEFACYNGAGGVLRTGEFLGFGQRQELAVKLNAQQQSMKRRMIDAFVTQRETLAPFGTDVERFRLAPEYDFTQPPHQGMLWYERFPWGMTGERFREIAQEVLL